MGRRQRARNGRAASPGRAPDQDAERHLAELEQAITELEECADGRLPEVKRPTAAGASGEDLAQALSAARMRLGRLHARMEALDRDPLAAARPRRGGRFRRAEAKEPPAEAPGARLVAVKLAEAGAPRAEVDEYLHDIFTLDDEAD